MFNLKSRKVTIRHMGQTYVKVNKPPLTKKKPQKTTNQYHLPKHTRIEEEENESYSK